MDKVRKFIRKEIEILFEFQASDLKHAMTKEPYADFVNSLESSYNNPKVKAALEGGMNDGDMMDDVISVDDTFIPCRQLITTQNEIDIHEALRYALNNVDRIKELLDNNTIEIKGPIVILDRKYIIDGHHRWAQAYLINPDISIKAKDLSGLKNIKSALKAVQTAIISSTNGTLPTESVKGKNIFTCSEDELKDYVINKTNESIIYFLSHYFKNKNKEEVKSKLADLIWKNLLLMREHNKPIKGAPSRSIMPQTDKVPGGVEQVTDKLQSGIINMNPPFFPKQ